MTSLPQQSNIRKNWDRLKPVKQDALDSVGFVSKGDSRLLDVRAQEKYYSTIVSRYMQFCTAHSKDLETAFASLSIDGTISASADPARNPPVASQGGRTGRQNSQSPSQSSPFQAKVYDTQSTPEPSSELSTILLALRKLREALLATSSSAVSPIFSQRVHVFSIRLAILAYHPPSYYPSLLHLLFVLHTPEHPLPPSELSEMTTYLILDLACRQSALSSAYSLRAQRRLNQMYDSKIVDSVLAALSTSNWIAFWRVRRKVDGYVRALLGWSIDNIRRTSLKTIGRAYLFCDTNWILQISNGDELSWEELKEKESLGWIQEGEKIIIRKIKTKPVPAPASTNKA